MRNDCAECGDFFKSREDMKLLIWAVGNTGHRTSIHVCAKCHQEAKDRGGPGPNARAIGVYGANSAQQRRDSTPLAHLGWGKRR
jgi:hypothetical protein